MRKRLSENPNAKYIDDLGIDTDKNLQYSIGHYTIINPHVDNGVFKGILIDKYDLSWLEFYNSLDYNDIIAYLANDYFVLIQLLNGHNYYILVPIIFKW